MVHPLPLLQRQPERLHHRPVLLHIVALFSRFWFCPCTSLTRCAWYSRQSSTSGSSPAMRSRSASHRKKQACESFVSFPGKRHRKLLPRPRPLRSQLECTRPSDSHFFSLRIVGIPGFSLLMIFGNELDSSATGAKHLRCRASGVRRPILFCASVCRTRGRLQILLQILCSRIGHGFVGG